MTREQWKAMLPFVQAFVNGEDVRCNGEKCNTLGFNRDVECYSIVKPPQYVPFANGDEFIKALGEQKVPIVKEGNLWMGVTYVRDTTVSCGSYDYDSEYLLKRCTFADGTPCGKLAE